MSIQLNLNVSIDPPNGRLAPIQLILPSLKTGLLSEVQIYYEALQAHLSVTDLPPEGHERETERLCLVPTQSNRSRWHLTDKPGGEQQKRKQTRPKMKKDQTLFSPQGETKRYPSREQTNPACTGSDNSIARQTDTRVYLVLT